ncbi:MAG: tandem-95 repeat protein, partial [Gammaproteobacteria bacterium]|nr:tandem-95 repeat protein [Gammaproteobacteria bacterium]
GFSIAEDGGGNMPLADVQSLLRGITYENSSQDPTAGDRTLDIEVQDVAGLISNTATSTITVSALNDAPTAANNTVTTNEDTTYTFTAADFNFSDVDGDTLTSIEITTLEAVGALQLSSVDVTLNQVITRADIDAGNLKFVPMADANGTGYDSFGFSVNDGTADSASTYTMTVDVTATNDDPVITSDSGSATANIYVVENTTAVTTVTATDADLETPTFSITGGADQGLFSIDLNSGVLTFDTAPDFDAPGDVGANNIYEVEVSADDGNGGTDVQLISVTVTDANEAPSAIGDTFNLNEDTPTNIDLLANDTDPENDTLTLLGFERVVASYDAGTSGSAVDPTSVAGGSWVFEDTEDANASTGNLQSSGVSPDGATGLNSWNLSDASDTLGENLWYSTTLSGADTALADANGWSLSADIRMVDDFGDTRTTFIRYGDGTTRFLAYFDLDSNDDLTVELIDNGGNQVITLTNDGNGSADYHHFEIVYDPVTATAMFLSDGVRVDAGGWSGEASANTGVRWGMGSGGGQGSANYHSIEMKVFDQSITTTNGATVTNNGDGTVNYAPAQDFNGADSFAYTMRDSDGHLDSATVNVTVTPVNDTPTLAASAADDSLTENTDTTSAAVFSTVTIDPIETGDDIASAQLTIAGGIENTDTLTINGTDITGLGSDSSGAITGGHSYSYTQATGVVTITFAGSTNAAAAELVLESITYGIDASDQDPSTTARTVTLNTVTDNGGGADTNTDISETATISVVAVNDVPVATGNTVIASEDVPLVIDASDFLFSDAESDSLVSVTITGLNLNGGTLTHSAGATTVTNGMTVTAAELADLTFTSALNDSTNSSFTYTVNDAGLGVTSSTMNITVNA